jgi:hypothetical protein
VEPLDIVWREIFFDKSKAEKRGTHGGDLKSYDGFLDFDEPERYYHSKTIISFWNK